MIRRTYAPAQISALLAWHGINHRVDGARVFAMSVFANSATNGEFLAVEEELTGMTEIQLYRWLGY